MANVALLIGNTRYKALQPLDCCEHDAHAGPDEFTGALGHIKEAKNLPTNELPTHLPDLVRDNRPVVVVCKTDRRSSIGARQLRQAGMADVSVLRGAMERWRMLGLPAS